MTTDPYKHHAELSCPCCHVKGKVITNSADGIEFDQGCYSDEPYVCCDCGASWLDSGTFCDDALKEYRVNLMRLVEGRPYEPPKPKPSHPSKLDFGAFDKMLADARRKTLPTGDIVTDLGGSIQISGSAAWGADDIPWTSVIVDDSGGHTICCHYRTKRFYWNLATDEVTEK